MSVDGMRGSRTRIRPWFRTAAIAVVVLLIPIAAHALWDFIEVRRLVREIEAIRAKGQPVTAAQAGRQDRLLDFEQARAGRYYEAAALVGYDRFTRPRGPLMPLREFLAGAAAADFDMNRATHDLDALVNEASDAFRLLDAAASLPFHGLAPGTDYNYRTSELLTLGTASSIRTATLSLHGAGDQAVDSAIATLRVRQTTIVANQTPEVPDIAFVLSFSSPSRQALTHLAAELALADRSGEVLSDVAADRARFIERYWVRYYGPDPTAPRGYLLPMRSFSETLWRPAFTHRFVSILRAWAEVVDAAGKPAPEEHDALAAISSRYAPHQWTPTTWTFGPPREMAWVTQGPLPIRSWGPAVTDSANRIAVAIELSRRDHAGAFPESIRQLAPAYLPREPLDPFSGRPFLVKRTGEAYTIYSVGPDRRDDGGDITSALTEARTRGWGRHDLRGRDIGIRILIHD